MCIGNAIYETRQQPCAICLLPGRGEITKIEKCDGDASANNRKAKLIFFYEWDLRLEWKGKLNGSDTEHHGTVEVPNLSDENDESDLDVSTVAVFRGLGDRHSLICQLE